MSTDDAAGAARKPVTLITGCSRGIGLALAQELARAGHTVVATVRDVPGAPSALRDAGCEVHALDVTSDASVAALAAHLGAAHGGVDVVVNNAGYGVPGTLESIPLAQQQALFDANVWGVVRLAQALLPAMRTRGGGVFLGVSSTSGVRTLAGGDTYGASKRAMEGLLEGLRYTVARDGVRVAVVNPGPVDTGFLKRFRAEGEIADSDGGAQAARPGTGAERRVWADWLGERITAAAQTPSECAAAIAGVVAREWEAVLRGDKSLATFWNGTDAASQQVIESVKREPTGTSGPYAAMHAEAQNRLDAAAGKP